MKSIQLNRFCGRFVTSFKLSNNELVQTNLQSRLQRQLKLCPQIILCSSCKKHVSSLSRIHKNKSINAGSSFKSFLFSSTPLEPTGNDVDFESVFPFRFVYVRTSINMWEDFPDGVQFDVGFVDTSYATTVSKRTPVILGIPSSVGTHEELQSSLLTFAKLGYRVIIPNLPDSQYCRAKSRQESVVFMHSVNERSAFIRDFLREIKVDKVDLCLVNRDSVYSGVHLATYNKGLVQALVLLNPTGIQYTSSMEPVLFHKYFSIFWDDRFILQPVIRSLVTGCKFLTKKKRWPTYSVITYSRIIRALSFTDVRQDAVSFRVRNVPTLAILGEDSAELNTNDTFEYLASLALPTASTVEWRCDQGNTTVPPKELLSGQSLVIRVPNAGPDLPTTHAVPLRHTLLTFLKAIRRDL
ncbi:uncharacterized protein LOC127851831 [Dreissena polymorpha]|nr:uncharacterized protein LOC127851831 [Dreissena polymorpha]